MLQVNDFRDALLEKVLQEFSSCTDCFRLNLPCTFRLSCFSIRYYACVVSSWWLKYATHHSIKELTFFR